MSENRRRLIDPSKSPKDASGAYVKVSPAAPIEPFKLSTYLFDKQLKFVEDPHHFKVSVCSRRSGKTVACAADLVDTALASPGTVSLYITLSRNNAKKLIWPEIQKINRNFALGGAEDMTELSMTFPNGAVIYCSGAKDASEIEKFRGLALKKVYIDECQSFRPYIQELIDDVIAPALLDYAGTLCLIGTPGPVPTGFFHDCAVKSENWSKHGWTFFDNPHIPIKSKHTHEQLLQRELKRRGVSSDDPSIQREFFGRWVLDSDSLLLHYNNDLNHYTQLPGKPEDYTYIMGIDLGFDDADAIAILAWSEKDPITYLVEEIVTERQGISELVSQVEQMIKKYNPGKMVIDQGGLGKKIAEEIRRRHHIPVQPADKARKMENVAFLNDALRTARFKAKGASKFASDSYLMEIDRAKSTPDRIKVSDKYHSDIIDAVLYAFRESPAYTYQEAKKLPKPGTREWANMEQDDMFEAALDHFEAQADLEKKFNGYDE